MDSIFDTKVSAFGFHQTMTGDIGIEIEAEGTKTGVNPMTPWVKNREDQGKPPKYWMAKGDNSLRNGVEYVTNGPVPLDKLSDAMDEWATYSKGTRYRHDTIRTSVHYHVNVQHLTLRQIVTVIMGWWLLETPIVDLQGPTRVGNLFCLRVSDAEHLVMDVLNSLEMDNPPLLGQHMGDNVKYAALNINAVRRFGSLEFRFNRGTTDPAEIEKWGRALHQLVHSFAKLGSTERLIELIEKDGPDSLLFAACPLWLRKEIRAQAGWQEKINSNYSYAYMIHSKLSVMYVKDESVRIVHRSYCNVDPELQEWPTEHKLFALEEFGLDEETLPSLKVRLTHKSKKKKVPNLAAQVGLQQQPPQEPAWAIVDEVGPDDMDEDFPDDDFPNDMEDEELA